MTLKSPYVCLSRKLALFLTVKYHDKNSILNLRKYLTIKAIVILGAGIFGSFSPASMAINLQTEAPDIVQARRNLYIGGQAGSRKSCVTRHIIQWAIEAGKAVHLNCTIGIACSVFTNVIDTNVTSNNSDNSVVTAMEDN